MAAFGASGWSVLSGVGMVGKIFLSVGSQMPFDRMVLAVCEWFTELPPGQRNWQVVAQVGQTALTLPEVNGWKTHAVLAEHDFHTYCRQADLIVGHAGMGLVLTALEFARPMLLMPRQGQKRETRNDHQLSTARWLQNQKGVLIAWEEIELKRNLARMSKADALNDIRLTLMSAISSSQNKVDLCSYLQHKLVHDGIGKVGYPYDSEMHR
jgi:UDP-N-acetylglucosamine transferase subunit ALG13